MEKIAKTLKKVMPILALSVAVITAVLDFSIEMAQLKEAEKIKIPEFPEKDNS